VAAAAAAAVVMEVVVAAAASLGYMAAAAALDTGFCHIFHFPYHFTFQLSFLHFLLTHLHNSLNDIPNIIKF
jgi:hypothetical protein